MKKAVKLHEDFKLAIKILRTKGMDAKKGRLLLKRHYVALLEQEGDKDAVKRKVSDLKQMFWSNEALVTKYITAHHGEDNDDDEENYDADDFNMMDSDSEDDERAPEEEEFDVGDEVDAFWQGDETNSARWELAVVEEVDHDEDRCFKYRVVYSHNGEEVSIRVRINIDY